MISAALLSRIMTCPLTLAQRWASPLDIAMCRFDIVRARRIAHFLAQLGHESQSLQRLQENLSYSRKRIGDVFGHRLSEPEQPLYVRRPERLANRVYAGRNGNGDEASGDGYRYRGRGPIALTGRANYRRIGTLIGHPLEQQPDLLETPEIGALAAAAWWQLIGANETADRNDVLAVSRLVNLGSANSRSTPEGIVDRMKRTEHALQAMEEHAGGAPRWRL